MIAADFCSEPNRYLSSPGATLDIFKGYGGGGGYDDRGGYSGGGGSQGGGGGGYDNRY